MRKHPLQIPNLLESLSMDIVCGKITMEEAALELNRYGHTPFVDIERTRKRLEPYIAKIATQKGAEK